MLTAPPCLTKLITRWRQSTYLALDTISSLNEKVEDNDSTINELRQQLAEKVSVQILLFHWLIAYNALHGCRMK
jgi:hypothetical protein